MLALDGDGIVVNTLTNEVLPIFLPPPWLPFHVFSEHLAGHAAPPWLPFHVPPGPTDSEVDSNSAITETPRTQVHTTSTQTTSVTSASASSAVESAVSTQQQSPHLSTTADAGDDLSTPGDSDSAHIFILNPEVAEEPLDSVPSDALLQSALPSSSFLQERPQDVDKKRDANC